MVLELLALAADRDDLNAELIAAGAGPSDFEFVNGWYRMSTYSMGARIPWRTGERGDRKPDRHAMRSARGGSLR